MAPLMLRGLTCLVLGTPVALGFYLDVSFHGLARPSERTAGEYYWPAGHGRTGQDGYSPYAGPQNLTADFDWSWHHPLGRFHTVPYGTAIDGEKNIYLFTDTSLWKLSPHGDLLWTFKPTPAAAIFSAGSLLDGRVHFTTLDGRFWAVSMATGEVLWSRKVCEAINYDNGFVSAHEGVVVAHGNAGSVNYAQQKRANRMVFALSAVDGSTLWSYEPQVPVWNFLASFPGDGTVLYQDWEGRAYCHNLRSGALIWKAGGHPASWTDGSPLLANGVLWTVSAYMTYPFRMQRGPLAPGRLTARNASSGQLLWEAMVPLPPNNAPALGRIPGSAGLTIIQPGGYQGVKGGATGIFAFDALTGAERWSFKGPPQRESQQAGMIQGFLERMQAGASPSYVTNPWSAPTIDVHGTVYIGHEDGLLFAIRDVNADGRIEGEGEVSTFNTGSAFVGCSSPAHAPGMLAVANCEGLFVFRAPLA